MHYTYFISQAIVSQRNTLMLVTFSEQYLYTILHVLVHVIDKLTIITLTDLYQSHNI